MNVYMLIAEEYECCCSCGGSDWFIAGIYKTEDSAFEDSKIISKQFPDYEFSIERVGIK